MPFDDDADLEYVANQLGSSSSNSSSNWQQLFDQLSGDLETRFGYKREYAQRQLKKESGGSTRAKSWAGAAGLMQLMPSTSKQYGVKDPTDPVQNIKGWHAYMADLLTTFDGDVDKAIGAYNAGAGAIQKHGLEKVRQFSNFPKGDPRRGGYKGSTGEYIDKIKGLDDIRAINRQLIQPISSPGVSSGSSQITQGADLEYALKNTPKRTQQQVSSSRAFYGAMAQQARTLNDPSSQIVNPNPEPENWMHQFGRKFLSEGVSSGVAGVTKSLAGAQRLGGIVSGMSTVTNALTGHDIPNEAANLESGFANRILTENAQESARYPKGGFGNQVYESTLVGAGAAIPQLTALAIGGPILKALNLPLQMGAGGYEEGGVPGLFKGATTGVVYHFGMGITAPLGRIGNALIWGTAAGTESAISGNSAPDVIASSLTMAGMAGMGPKRVEIGLPDGSTRAAKVSDLLKIKKGLVTIVPPTPEARSAYEQVQQEGMNYYRDNPAQTEIRAGKQSHIDRMEEIRQKRLVKQFPELQQEKPITYWAGGTPEEIEQYLNEHPTRPDLTAKESKALDERTLVQKAEDDIAERMNPFELKVVQKAFEKAGEADRLFGLLNVKKQLESGVEPRALKFLDFESKKSSNERYELPLAEEFTSDLSMREIPLAHLRDAVPTGRVPQELMDKLDDFKGNLTEPQLKILRDAHPELTNLSDAGILDALDLNENGTEMLSEALGPKIKGTNLSISDPTFKISQETLSEMGNSPEFQEYAKEVENVFNSIRSDLGEGFDESVLGGFEVGDPRRFAYNRQAIAYSDGKSRIFLNGHTAIAAFNGLHSLGYLSGRDIAPAMAQFTVETLYHEFFHELDRYRVSKVQNRSGGVEGHGPEWDQGYKRLITDHADNLIKYARQLEKVIAKGETLNDLEQQALESGAIEPRGKFSNSFAGDLIGKKQLAIDSILEGTSNKAGLRLAEDPEGLSKYSHPSEDQFTGPDSFPLYKSYQRERLIEWAKKRSENLDRFMGEKSVFKRKDGFYAPQFHATSANITEFRPGDIGIHAGTAEAANWRNAAKEHVYVKGEGYERYVLNSNEALQGKPNRWWGETVETKEGTNILPVFMKLENPARIDDVDSHNPKIVSKELQAKGIITEEEALAAFKEANASGKKGKQIVAEQFEQFRQLLESKGYDGLVYENIFEGAPKGKAGREGTDSYIVFRPEQIKSAIGNSGEFNPHDPNILHSSDPISLGIKSAIETGKLLYKAGTKFAEWSGKMISKFGPGIKLHLENIWHAVVNLHNDERGFVNLGAKKFLDEDIAPAAKSSGVALHAAWDSILKRFAPAARGVEAKEMAGLVRHKGSELWLKYFRAEHALNQTRSVLDSLPQADRWEFIDHIENGRAQTNTDLQSIADVMRRLLDEGRYSIQHLGTGKLQTYYENYFPHIWKDPARAQQIFTSFMGKRPLAGKKSFLKRRTFPTFADGLNDPNSPNYDPKRPSLEPISDNPVDLVLLKLHEVNKYIMGVQVMQELKGRGMAKFVKAGKIEFEKTQGLAEINDTIASVFGGGPATPQGGQLLRGKYMVPENAAQVINNYLSPGLRKNAAFRGYMTIANTLNQFQLGWSFFHAGFTTIDAMISKFALGQKYLAAGKPVKAIENFVRSNPLTAPIENIYRGHQVLKEAMNPGSAPQYAEIVKKLTAGGFRPKMEKIYTNDMVTKFKAALRSGNYPGAIFRAPLALTEVIAKPVLEELVPRQKLGVAADMVRFELDRNPNMDIYEQRRVIGKVVDSVDNRLGQMTYDNKFWNRVAKDLAMFGFRSVGWNVGTFGEIGGGAYDLGKMPIDLLRGEKPELTHRTSYIIALPLYTAFLGAITQYLYTGKGPEEGKDYFFPRTGNLDERGNPERVNLPTYIKDVYHYRDVGGPHTRKTLISKLHPALSLIGDMLQNEDYFGVEIANEDDSFLDRTKDRTKFLGKSVLPFGIQNFQKERERGSSIGKSLVPILTGITPAPSDINQTPAEEELYEYNQKTRPAGTRTKFQADRTKTMFDIKKSILKQDGQAASKAAKAINDGILTTDDMSLIVKQLSKSPLQTRFAGTDPFEAIKVWNKMNDKEKEQVRDLMTTKTQKVMELPPAQRDRLLEKYQIMTQYYQSRSTQP